MVLGSLRGRGFRARPNVRAAALALIAFLLVFLPLKAQVNTGRISGAVTDQSGGAIAGAKVTVTNVARGESRVLTTDAAGQYAAPNLDPGIYTVQAEFMGFQTVNRQNIDVGVGGDVRVDVTLQPGAQTQTVTVTEALPIVNTTNAQTGGTLDNQLLTSIPISGRNYRWQQSLVEGVTLLPGHGSSTTNVNGTTDGEGDNMILDGVYGKTQFTGEFTFGGSGEAGDATLIPLDMIQEVDVITNPKAEYGYVSGSTLNVGLKSGTNNLHGSAWAFGRQGPDLEARNAFATTNHPLSFEQYGGTVGGPIKKDKIFYQLGYEGFFENYTTVVQDTAPVLVDTNNTGLSIPDAIAAINALPTGTVGTTTLNELSVNLAGCNWNNQGIHSMAVSQVVAACANGNQYGAPGLWNGNLGVLPNNGFSGTGLGKVDYHINDHHDLNGSFGRGYYYEQAAANNGTSILDNWWEQIYGVKAQESRIAWVWTPNSSWLNEFRWGLDLNTRPVSTAECTPQGNPFAGTSFGSNGVALGLGASEGNYGGPNYAKEYGFVSGAPACGFPTTVLSAPVSAQLGQSKDRGIQDNDDQFTDNLSYTRGTHQFKFGADIRAVTFIGAKTTNQQDGTLNFGQSGAAGFSGATSLEDFLVGVPSSETVRGGDPNLTLHLKYMAFFAQDDWRILRKLTLNLGYRDEVFTPDTTTGYTLGNFNPSTPSGITAANSVWTTMNRPEPRFGFSYDLTGKGTTVVRGSIGILGDVQRQSSIISGGGAFDLSAAPTGEALYNAAGVRIMAPGNGQSSIVTLLPVSGTTGATKGIVTSTPIPWPTNSQYNYASPQAVFPSPVPEACGNGLAPINPAPGAPTINPNPCGMYGVPTNMNYNHYMFWNVNVQHAFTNNLSLDVGYVGSRTWDLQEYINVNQAVPNANSSQATASFEQSVAPYENQFPWFSTITEFANAGNVNFKSLQVHLVNRVTHGLTFNVAYTLQENQLSEGQLNVHIPVTNGTNGPYSDNQYPAQHIAVTYSYAVPGIKSPGQMLQGWTLSGAVDILSAIPYCTSDTKDDTSGAGAASTTTWVGAGCGTGTPWNLVGSAAPISQLFGRAGTIPCYGVLGSKFTPTATPTSNGCIAVASVSNLPAPCIAAADSEAPSPGSAPGAPFTTQLAQLAAIGCYEVNGSSIVPPAQGNYGTMPFYALHGAGFSQVNISLEKEWKIKERFTTQFKFDVFNLFNRTMYYGDNVNVGAPNNFGESTGTPDVLSGGGPFSNGGPRAMQFGLKLIF
jgi:hypothetical protein